MQKLEFLKAVLPPGARYSLCFIKPLIKPDGGKGEQVIRRMFDDVEEITDQRIESYVEQGFNAYYATAGFGADTKANAANAVRKKEIYLDVDCGPTKPHSTKVEGLQALKSFTESLGLPRPTIIDSGNGIHAHWYFTESVPVHEWQGVARAFKDHHKKFGLDADPTATLDVVRVLRIPGTVNTKGGNEVKLLTPVKFYDFETLKQRIGSIEDEKEFFAKVREVTGGELVEAEKFKGKNKPQLFERIIRLSEEGKGCAHALNAVKNAHTLSEPVWYDWLSIAQFCEDKEYGIRIVSEGHPDYSPEVATEKAARAPGPHSCEVIAQNGPKGLCDGCAFKGKITGPILIGSYDPPAELNIPQSDGSVVPFTLPQIRFPYFRGPNGGIYAKGKNNNDEVLVPYDLYVFARNREVGGGDVIWVRYHLPHDGIREFSMTQSEWGSPEKLRDRLSAEGVTILNQQAMTAVHQVLGYQIRDLQESTKADDMYARFGWTPNNTFVLGNIEYGPQGGKHAPTVRTLDKYVKAFTPTGTFEKWREVIDLFDAPEMDDHAFAILCGFGSPLMKLTPEVGGAIALVSKLSGSGKTTATRAASSIFGNCMDLEMTDKDTEMAKVHRLGLLNGVVSSVDEVTNALAENLSNLIYTGTHGSARNRMQAGVNAERVNNTSWAGLMLMTSNSSIEDKLSSIKIDPQGELARLIEIRIGNLRSGNPLLDKHTVNKMKSNFGHAGHQYIAYVVANQDKVTNVLAEAEKKIYARHRWTPTERYQLNILVVAFAGGIIARALGLINYNVERIINRRIDALIQTTNTRAITTAKSVEIISTYVAQHLREMLTIKGNIRVGTMGEAPISTPQGNKLSIRYEPDTDTLFLTQRDFNKWCVDNAINSREIPGMFKEETGKEFAPKKSRIGKGYDSDFGPVNVYIIENAKVVMNLEDMNHGNGGTAN